jgi:hypothetical protein
LQLLDVSFFKSVNSFCDSVVQNLIRQHSRPVSEWQIAEWFAEAYNRAATAKNAQNGFAECGIHPYNSNKFDDENFLPSDFTDRPEEAPAPSTSTSAVTSMPAQASPLLSENEPSAAELSCSKPTESLATCTINDRSPGNAEFPASSAPIVVEIVDVNGVSRIQHFEAGEDVIISMDSAAEENVLTTEHPVIEPTSSPTTFRDLVSVPRLSSRQNASKRKCTVNHAELLTTSPYKTQLELNRSVMKTPQQAVSKRSKQNKNKTSLPPNTEEVHVQANINEKSVKSRARRKPCKPKYSSEKQHFSDDAACLYCNELWSESEGLWIQCQGVCGKWAHTACAGIGRKDTTLVNAVYLVAKTKIIGN